MIGGRVAWWVVDAACRLTCCAFHAVIALCFHTHTSAHPSQLQIHQPIHRSPHFVGAAALGRNIEVGLRVDLGLGPHQLAAGGVELSCMRAHACVCVRVCVFMRVRCVHVRVHVLRRCQGPLEQHKRTATDARAGASCFVVMNMAPSILGPPGTWRVGGEEGADCVRGRRRMWVACGWTTAALLLVGQLAGRKLQSLRGTVSTYSPQSAPGPRTG